MLKGKDPFAALKYREFLSLITGNLINTAALLIQEVLLGYELYKITRNPLTLGLIGLAEAIPYISLALFGGHFADKLDKKKMMKWSLSVIIVSSICLAIIFKNAHSISENTLLAGTFIFISIIGFAKGFYHPAASSLKAFLTPREVYSNAASWGSTFWQIGAVLGPGIAGFLYANYGLVTTLIIVVVLLAINFVIISNISKTEIKTLSQTNQNIWQSIREGFVFVYNTKILLYSISLDLVAVLFGGVVAILPIFAEDILKVGPQGLGILRAAPSIGAILTIFATTVISPTDRAWRNMIIAVSGFGIATIIFALSTNFILSVVMLFLTGAFDSISVVIRQTILQVIPPEHMRGRVVSVNSIFVTSSNEIGAFESGLAASLFGTVPSVVIGGGITIIIIFIVFLRSKELINLKL
ncbi:MAG: MFS transporter [Bacteroidota bacterium]